MADIFVCADAIIGAATIRQVVNSDHQTNQEIRKAMVSGGNAVTQVSGKASAEMTSFSSGDIAALLALNSNTFIAAGKSELSSTITIPYKLRQNAGSFQAAASNHPWITGSNALIVPVSVEASQDADFASMQCEVHWLSTDGITQGATEATGQTLATQSFNSEFALSDVYINGSAVPGVQSVRCTTGIEVVKPPLGSGSVFPKQASIKNIIPTIEITTNDIAAVTATVGAFTAMTSAVVYFRKRSDAGVYVAKATAGHCSLTFGAGLADSSSVSVSNNEDGTCTIVLHGKTLTASAATAIP
jgi:hypothetical protein